MATLTTPARIRNRIKASESDVSDAVLTEFKNRRQNAWTIIRGDNRKTNRGFEIFDENEKLLFGSTPEPPRSINWENSRIRDVAERLNLIDISTDGRKCKFAYDAKIGAIHYKDNYEDASEDATATLELT